MNRRELLKSTMIAGVGAMLTGNTITAAVPNAGAGQSALAQSGSAILTKRRRSEK